MNFGILKSKLIKIIFSIIAIILLIITIFSVYMFISSISENERSIILIIKSYTSTVVMWTTITVIALKVIFSKSNEFFRIMENFPVSNKSKNLSIFIFESIFSLLLISIITFSFILAILLNEPIKYSGYLIVNVFYMSTLTYVLLQLFSKTLAYACNILNIEKVFSVLNISMLTICFIFIYKNTESVTKNIINDYINHENNTNNLFLALNTCYENLGLTVTTLIYLSIMIILSALIIIIPDKSYLSHSRYILLFKKGKINMFKSYIVSIIRDKNMINNILSAYIFAILLISINLDEYILYSLLIIAFNSMYSFVQTLYIRYINYSFVYSYTKDYVLLILSQLLINYIVALPMVFVYVFLNGIQLDIIYPLISITIAIFLLTLVGILFPPYNDNPFSIITSLIIVSIPVLFIIITLTFLNLSLVLNVIVFIILFGFILIFSIIALYNAEKRYKNEKTDLFS